MYYLISLIVVIIILVVIQAFRNAPVYKQWDDIIEENKKDASELNDKTK